MSCWYIATEHLSAFIQLVVILLCILAFIMEMGACNKNSIEIVISCSTTYLELVEGLVPCLFTFLTLLDSNKLNLFGYIWPLFYEFLLHLFFPSSPLPVSTHSLVPSTFSSFPSSLLILSLLPPCLLSPYPPQLDISSFQHCFQLCYS